MSLSRISSILKHPNKSFFNPINIFWHLLPHSISNVPFVVVGTKADHEEGRKVAHGTVAEFCDISPGTRFFETSARVPGEGAPILHVFEDLVHRCVEKNRQEQNIENGIENKEMDETSDGQKKVYGDAYDRNGRGCADECVVS